MKDSEIPTLEDWGDYLADLDVKCAHEIFYGKSREEVQPDFARCVIERAGDLWFMPRVPFRYYMLAFRDFVLSPKLMTRETDPESWAPDAASCFLNLIVEKAEKAPEDIAPILQELLPAAEHVASHQEGYRANPEIYGDFGAKLLEIRRRAKAA